MHESNPNPSLKIVAIGGGTGLSTLLAGLKHFAAVPGFVSDQVVLKGLTIVGGSGFTPESMAAAVRLIEEGVAHAAELRGEVFRLEELDTALRLLARQEPGRDAVRVTLVHD